MENHVQLEENMREQAVTLVPDSSSTETVSSELASQKLKEYSYDDIVTMTSNYANPITVNSELASQELKRYSYDDIVTMTSNFANPITSGSFADSYKGQLPNGVQVAVRELHIPSNFCTEDFMIQTVYHQNIVRLYGFYTHGYKVLLVYEYMDSVSLALILYKNHLGVEWDKFYGIAVEMAKALAYLHDIGNTIYQGFRAADVILDSKLCPKLTNFRLTARICKYGRRNWVRILPNEELYVAPEVISQSYATFESVVYSFGILLFEMLNRQKLRKEDNQILRIAWDFFKEKRFDELVAFYRIKEKDKKKAIILTMVAFWCIQCTPSPRPSMSTVAVVLETQVFVNKPPNPFKATSRCFEMQPQVNYSEVSSLTHSEVSLPTVKMQPHVNHSEILEPILKVRPLVNHPAFRGLEMQPQVNYSEVSSLTHSEVSLPTVKMQPQENHSEILEPILKVQPLVNHPELSSSTRSEVSLPIVKMQPQVNHSEVSSFTRSEVSDPILKMQQPVNHSEVSSFTHSEISSFSLDVLPELENPEEQQLQEEGNAGSSSTKILMHELSFQEQIRYSYDELTKFSANFSDRIGGGAYGDVFKGQLSNGVNVAIKVLKTNNIIEQTFLAEVRTMGNTKHQSLIKLIGFCSEGTHMALIYDYMEMGSLDRVLYEKSISIEWGKLYRIAVDIARALAHLHHDCKPQIIHFDVKPANILLDVDHSPKLTDFGLATLNDKGATHVTMSDAKGTVGFGAPEVWVPFAHVTYKCDVYSFGMVLLEILGMARNDEVTEWFPKYVWQMYNIGNLNDVIVECGIKEKDRKKATLLATVALWCIQYTPETRPSMITVVKVLEELLPVNRPPDPFQTSDWTTSMHSELNSRDDIPLNLKNSRARIKSMMGLFEQNMPFKT